MILTKIKAFFNRWKQAKRYNWKKYDYSILIIVTLLSIISSYVLSIIGASSFKRQFIAISLTVVIMVVVSLIDYHTMCSYVPILYVIGTISVFCTKFTPLGSNSGTDSYRWLDFKILMFQPSEVVKIIIILTLATFFAHYKDDLQSFKIFFMACGLALLPTLFILVQSDLSSSVVIVMVFVIMLMSSGIGRKIIAPIAAVLIPIAGFLIWYVQQPNQKLLHGYQLSRITGWLNPESAALSVMYQQNNSVLSIASGKLYGKMLIEGSSGARNYTAVDVIESDFIWTPISEEFGFIGCLAILSLLSVIIIKSFIAAKRAKDYQGMMIALGIGSMFCFQVFFNIGVATSLLPNTGLPLPFLSNGISSLISSSMAVGILINIGIQPNRGGVGSFVETLDQETNY